MDSLLFNVFQEKDESFVSKSFLDVDVPVYINNSHLMLHTEVTFLFLKMFVVSVNHVGGKFLTFLRNHND